MPATPNKININFARNNYNVFGQRPSADQADQQQEQKTELLEGTRENGLFQLKSNINYINLGEEDQMEIYGYKRNYIRTAITWFLIVATGGLLRLFFHWFPRFMLVSTHSHCPLKEADTVLLLERFQEKHTSFYVKRLKSMTAEEIVKYAIEEEALGIEQWTENGSTITFKDDEKTLMLSIHLNGGVFKNVESIDTFSCKKLTYIWDAEKCEFMKLRGLDTGVLTSTLHQMPVLNAEQQFMRRSVYGNNEIVVPIKSILTLLCLEVLNPFYVFQLFSFGLWISDDYVYYAMAILFISSVCVAMEVFQTRKNQRNLRSTVTSSDVATVLRDKSTGLTATIPAEHLVPGDILVIPSHGCQMPCDAVLITGNCILNESMLTGESVPVTKTPVQSSNDMMYDTKEHARHTLFCGTRVLQTRYFGTEKVLAVVIRTGFSTSKGGLVRSIMYPPPVDFKFEQDSYKFVILLAVIASFGMIYTIINKSLKGLPAREIALLALDLITIVVPPALPAAMSVGRHVAQSRLKKKRIYCTSPRAVNVSGSIDCVCFDKTGTLTEDGLDMWGIVPVSSNKFQFPIKDLKSLPLNETLIGMVTCHGITIIEGQLVGDPLDLKMFESTGWILEEPDVSDTSKFSMLFPTVVRPPNHLKNATGKQVGDSVSSTRQDSLVSDNAVENISLNNLDVELTNAAMSLTEQGVEVGIVRQFPFTSTLQRMSVITRTLGANHYDLYCKGSPEVILSLSKPESIPSDFDSVLQEYTSEGYRVIALAYKSLKRLPYTKVQRMMREAAETDLNFLGFVVLENRLKPETTPVIAALNTACIKVVMVTGDNILTALSVARDCDIIIPGTTVIAVNALAQQNQAKPKVYFTRSNSQQNPASPTMGQTDISEINSIATLETIENGTFINQNENGPANYLSNDLYHCRNKYVFALTGKTWALIKHHYPELIPKIVTRGAVFARMSPDQKQQLVQELQALGYYVAMVGDGANDCGALKAAHTGISLSDTESSVASPFTSRDTNISCVLNVVREGRAALVTSFGIFKYMAAYSLTQFISVMLLYGIESNLTDIEFLYIDLGIISLLAFFFGRTEAYEGPLVKTPPLTSLISLTPILSLLGQLLLIFIFQFSSLFHLRQNEWFVPYNVTASKENGCLENYTIFIVSSFQYIILAAVFSKGQPYRKSIFTNHALLASFVLISLFSSYLAISPCAWLRTQFELDLPDDFGFRVGLVAYGFANLVLAILVEHFLIEYLIFQKLRQKWRNVDKSKRSFLRIERDLLKDQKWPPLTQEPPQETSSDIVIRQNVTEIKIEKRNSEPFESVEGMILASPEYSARFCKGGFGSAREVTLNPRSLYNEDRNTMSLQTVPNYYEEREVTPMRKILPKRRHNSESEPDSAHRTQETNAIATLPRQSSTQQQKIRDLKNVLLHKSEELALRASVQNGLENQHLPS